MRQSASCFGQGAVPVAVRASLSADLNPKTQTSDWEAVFVGSLPNFAVTSGKFLYQDEPLGWGLSAEAKQRNSHSYVFGAHISDNPGEAYGYKFWGFGF